MAPKLYYMDVSPPVRAVLMTAKAIGLDMDLKPVNLVAGEHLTAEYIKMNPQHSVPTLDDNGYIIWDSHAICAYLVGKYAKDDSLYPKDLQKRGTVDQRLYYNSNVVQPRFGAIARPIITGETTTIPNDKAELVHQAYAMLEAFLEDKTYFTGETLTIADICFAAILSTSSPFIPVDKEKLPRLSAWLSRVQVLPWYQVNKPGLEKMVQFLKSKLG